VACKALAGWELCGCDRCTQAFLSRRWPADVNFAVQVMDKTVDRVRTARVRVVPRARFERATYGLGNRCSVQLSYRGKLLKTKAFPLFSFSVKNKLLTLCRVCAKVVTNQGHNQARHKMDNDKHEPKIRETIVRVKGREYPRVIADFGMKNGKRERKTFKTRKAAERAVATWQTEQKILARRIGEGAQRFLTGDVQDAAAALQVLGNGVTLAEAATTFKTVRDAGLTMHGIQDAAEAVKALQGKATLTAAARFYFERHFPDGGGRTIGELVADYVKSREDVDRRAATIRDILCRLGCATPRNIERNGGGTLHIAPAGFAHDFAAVPVAHVTTTDLEKWMGRHAGKSKYTRRNMRVHLVALFNFAKARKYIRENPAEALITPKTSKNAKTRPYVLPPEDVEKLLRYAAAHDPETVPYFAICIFAGIRPNGEANRLTWAAINFERREIDIRADTSKTGDERFVEMSDNLIEWLLPYRKHTGPIYPTRGDVERVRRKSGVRWAPDCMRHSFGSYHMAQHENAGKTALAMGHRTIDTTFEHYRRAVHKEDAARFWNIKPEGAQVIEFRVNAG
jgi:integrase